MDMKVILVLVDTDQALMFRKEFIYKLPADFHALGRSDFFIPVKTDDVMGIHPSRVLMPQPFFVQKGSVDVIPGDRICGIWPSNIDKTILHLLILKNILDNISHCSM